MEQQRIVRVIERIRREDSDFLTDETVQTYTGCTASEARDALIAVFGAEWYARTATAKAIVWHVNDDPAEREPVEEDDDGRFR